MKKLFIISSLLMSCFFFGCACAVGDYAYLKYGSKQTDCTFEVRYNKKSGEFYYKRTDNRNFGRDEEYRIVLKQSSSDVVGYLDEGYVYQTLAKIPFEKLLDENVKATEENANAKMAFFIFWECAACIKKADTEPNEVFYPRDGVLIYSDHIDYMDYDFDGNETVTYGELFTGVMNDVNRLLTSEINITDEYMQ